jgi:hypothetical protein
VNTGTNEFHKILGSSWAAAKLAVWQEVKLHVVRNVRKKSDAWNDRGTTQQMPCDQF